MATVYATNPAPYTTSYIHQAPSAVYTAAPPPVIHSAPSAVYTTTTTSAPARPPSTSSSYSYLPWINLFLIIILIIALIVIFVLYFGREVTSDIRWAITYSPTTGTTDTFTISNYALYINSLANLALTINAGTGLAVGQEFAISNTAASSMSFTAGTGATIHGSTIILANTMAIFVCTAANTYTRIQ